MSLSVFSAEGKIVFLSISDVVGMILTAISRDTVVVSQRGWIMVVRKSKVVEAGDINRFKICKAFDVLGNNNIYNVIGYYACCWLHILACL